MKLLSMKLDGEDRAGILIGEEALDLTSMLEGLPGATGQRQSHL